MALIKCKECKEKISSKAKTCPHCGAENKKRSGLGFVSGLVILIILVWIGSTISGNNYETKKTERAQAEIQQKTTYFINNKATIIANINKQIKEGKYKNALIQIDAYKHTGDADLLKLDPIVREQTTLATLKTIPASKIEENLKLYKQLEAIKPANTKYKNKVSYYQKKVDAEKAIRADRIAKFGKQPVKDSWNGGYREVEKYLKFSAHDPDSIEFDNCSSVYHITTGWLVRCTYRGKNTFGALVRNTNWFTIKHGAVIKQHEATAYKL
mgnify:CR=1 FL=1